MGISTEAVKQYKRPKHKWKKELKYPKKKNKIISRIAKKSSSRRELKKIKKLKDKASRKRCDYSRDSYRDYCDSPNTEIVTLMKIDSLLDVGREIDWIA